MTTNQKETKCNYCWRSAKIGEHNVSCPTIAVDSKAATAEWKRGYAHGFSWTDDPLEWWQFRFYSATYILGYHEGKEEIEDLVDQAIESNSSYGEGW